MKPGRSEERPGRRQGKQQGVAVAFLVETDIGGQLMWLLQVSMSGSTKEACWRLVDLVVLLP